MLVDLNLEIPTRFCFEQYFFLFHLVTLIKHLAVTTPYSADIKK